MSLRWLSYVASKPSKGGSKTQNGRFRCKIALRLKKVCYKVSLCENCQRQSCKAFIGLTIRAKMIGGGNPFYLGQTDRVGAKWRFSIYFNLLRVTCQWNAYTQRTSLTLLKVVRVSPTSNRGRFLRGEGICHRGIIRRHLFGGASPSVCDGTCQGRRVFYLQ